MLVGQSTPEYVLIWIFIALFSYTGLLCLGYFYLILSIFGPHSRVFRHPVSIAIYTLGAIEILFYLLWFLPYKHYLHARPPQFPQPLERQERERLFENALRDAGDVELFARKWMKGAHADDVRRGNVREWLFWAVFDREERRGGEDADIEAEVESYLTRVDEKLGWKIKDGYGPAESLRLNFEKFSVSHRSLLYYMSIGLADFVASMTLLALGFTHYRTARSSFLRSFPLRPLTLLAPKTSASPHFSYFYRPHKSTTHRPVVFIHGIGIGLSIYIPLFLTLPKDVGILAIEILPVSSRITTGLPTAPELMRQCENIIQQQNLESFVFIGNSFGTFFAPLFQRSDYLSTRMHSSVLIDPVAVVLHLPDVAYNFTTRKPREANELQLWWAAQTEPDVSFTLARRFCWHHHVLFQEDLVHRPTTLIMGGRDNIVNPAAIAQYVVRGQLDPAHREDWAKYGFEEWTGTGAELVWLEGRDHGQWLFRRNLLRGISGVTSKYAEINGKIRDTRGEEEAKLEEGKAQDGRRETWETGEGETNDDTKNESSRRQTVA